MSGSEVNSKSIEWAEENILRLNPFIKKHFPGLIRLQKDSSKIFEGAIIEEDKFDFSICNPPFFNEEDDRKLRKSSACPIQDSEDCTNGGEIAYLQKMAQESLIYSTQITWFTSLIGKKTTFNFMITYLREMIDTDDLDIIIATHEI